MDDHKYQKTDPYIDQDDQDHHQEESDYSHFLLPLNIRKYTQIRRIKNGKIIRIQNNRFTTEFMRTLISQ